MGFSRQIEAFIKDFVKELEGNNAAVFAGAGMSKSQGYVDWPELLRDIAQELGLEIEKEHDLIGLAQFHVNERKGSAALQKKILQEFSEQAELSETHKILAALPIGTFWTTNYDSLIEDALKSAYKIADVKHNVSQLHNTRPKRDAVVYKMHGDVTNPQDAILAKEQYEQYHITHQRFVTTLSGDLVSKTFLFIGFSFTDPNLDYIFSRLWVQPNSRRQHYCFMREESVNEGDEALVAYKSRKQALRIEDLKRYGIQTLLINDYKQIPEILKEIEFRFRKNTIFISGSAEEFGDWPREQAQQFIHGVAQDAVSAGLRIVNGFGWGVGSAVINGALDAIYNNPSKFTEDLLIVRPFPQTGSNLPVLWEEYRQRMISLAGIALFFFGNKIVDGNIVNAPGVRREFEIALQHGLVPIPIAATGYMAFEIWNEAIATAETTYAQLPDIVSLIRQLDHKDPNEIRKLIGKVLKKLRGN